MTDGTPSIGGMSVPPELRHPLPRRIRLAARGIYYLAGSTVVSALLVAFLCADVLKTSKARRNGAELASDGQVVLTSDVHAGGMHSATVYYSFMFKGATYHGESLLPRRYLKRVENYSRSGGFSIVFLARDPSINHPNDWRDDESYSILPFLLASLVILQWYVLIRFIVQDLRLARDGVAVIGRVTRCSLARNGGIRLKYEFRDSEDLLMEGSGEYPVRRKQDEEICVLFLPENSAANRPYPLVFFQATR